MPTIDPRPASAAVQDTRTSLKVVRGADRRGCIQGSRATGFAKQAQKDVATQREADGDEWARSLAQLASHEENVRGGARMIGGREPIELTTAGAEVETDRSPAAMLRLSKDFRDISSFGRALQTVEYKDPRRWRGGGQDVDVDEVPVLGFEALALDGQTVPAPSQRSEYRLRVRRGEPDRRPKGAVRKEQQDQEARKAAPGTSVPSAAGLKRSEVVGCSRYQPSFAINRQTFLLIRSRIRLTCSSDCPAMPGKVQSSRRARAKCCAVGSEPKVTKRCTSDRSEVGDSGESGFTSEASSPISFSAAPTSGRSAPEPSTHQTAFTIAGAHSELKMAAASCGQPASPVLENSTVFMQYLKGEV